MGADVISDTKLTESKHWRKQHAVIQTNGMVLSFVLPPLNSRSTQPFILNWWIKQVPYQLVMDGRGMAGHASSAGWQITPFDPIWHAGSHSGTDASSTNCYTALPYLNWLGPFHGAIAVTSVTHCRCCCGHRFYITIHQVSLLSHAACTIAIAGFG